MPGEVEAAIEEARDRDLVGGDQRGRRSGPQTPASRAIRSAGKRAGPARGTPAGPAATRSGGGSRRRPAVGVRQAYWIGSRMSGVPSCALREPSTNWTAEWTTLCGWMTTSIGVVADIV